MRAEVLEKISRNMSSPKVNLVNMNITDEEILEVIETIQRLKPEASTIDLDNNNIGDNGASILSKCLQDFHHLTELSIQFNNIGKAGAIELFSLKKNFSDLDILFHGNKITDEGEMYDIENLALQKNIFGK